MKKTYGYRTRLKNDRFGVKRHRSVHFDAFRRFHDPVLGFCSNLGCRGYFRYEKHWDIIHFQKITNMLWNATARVLARFDVSMILCLDLAQTWVVRVILDIKNIGIPFIKTVWHKTSRIMDNFI